MARNQSWRFVNEWMPIAVAGKFWDKRADRDRPIFTGEVSVAAR